MTAAIVRFEPRPLTWEDIERLRESAPRAVAYFNRTADYSNPEIGEATVYALPPRPETATAPQARKCGAKRSPRPIWQTERAWIGAEGIAAKCIGPDPIERLKFTARERVKVGRKWLSKPILPSLSALLKTDAWRGSSVDVRTVDSLIIVTHPSGAQMRLKAVAWAA